MKINLGGIIPFSTIDWRGKAAIVIFLGGCPLRCIYCQNCNLLEGSNYVERHEIEDEIKKNEGRVKNTLAVCGNAKIDLELITTVFKHLVGVEEVKRIAKDLEAAGAANCPYVIQQGRVELVPGTVIREGDMFSYEELKELAALAYARLNDVRIRTREEGEEVIYR